MTTKNTYLIKQSILCCIIFCLVFPQSGCVKKCKAPTNGYIFVLPHSVSPAQTVYRTGDTISIDADFSHDIMEVEGGTYRLENFSFMPVISLIDLRDSNLSSAVKAFSSCEILLEEDTNLYFDGIGPRGDYTYRDGRYHLSFKFRPLKPGFYALRQKSLTYSSSLGNEANFPGRCDTRGSVGAFLDVNNGEENNYHLLQDEHFEVATTPWRVNQENFHRDGVFLFYVEE